MERACGWVSGLAEGYGSAPSSSTGSPRRVDTGGDSGSKSWEPPDIDDTIPSGCPASVIGRNHVALPSPNVPRPPCIRPPVYTTPPVYDPRCIRPLVYTTP